MIAQDVMDGSAALLNDTALSVFTYAAQIPYLNIALDELVQELELNNVPITYAKKDSITVLSGIEGIGGGAGQPALPPGFVEPITLYERVAGSTYSYCQMVRRDFVPVNQVPTAYLIYWSYEGETIHFIPGGATGNVEIQLQYIKSIFPKITIETDAINYDKGKLFLTYRNAALCAQFIGENKERADDLNSVAGYSLGRTVGISTKGKQAVFTRRKPFMAGWRARRVV
jgi:hypothetical protein